MKTHLITFALLVGAIASTAPSHAQTTSTQETTRLYWTIEPSLDRTIALNLRIDLISSISLHTYLLNGRIPITEMLVRTSDGHVVSLYTIREDKVSASDHSTREYFKEFINNAEINCKGIFISKHYPGESTRGVVEFYIENKSKLWDIYDALNEAMLDKKNLITNL